MRGCSANSSNRSMMASMSRSAVVGLASSATYGPDLLEVLLGKSGQPIGHLRLLGASRPTARLDPLGELPA